MKKKLVEIILSEPVSTAVLNFGIYVITIKLWQEGVDSFVVGWAVSSILISSLGAIYANLSRYKYGIRLLGVSVVFVITSIVYLYSIQEALTFSLYGFSQALKKLFYFKNSQKYLIYVAALNYSTLILFLIMMSLNLNLYTSLATVAAIAIAIIFILRLYIETENKKLPKEPRNVLTSSIIIGINSLLVAFFFQGQVLLADFLEWSSDRIVHLSIIIICLNFFVTLSSHEINSKFLRLLSKYPEQEAIKANMPIKYVGMFLASLPLIVWLWVLLTENITILSLSNFIIGLIFVLVFIYYMDTNLLFRVIERYEISLFINMTSIGIMCFIFFASSYYGVSLVFGPLIAASFALFMSLFIRKRMMNSTG